MIGFENIVLKSQHLTFRLLQEQDKEALAPILREPETTKPSGFLPVCTEEELEEFWKGLTRYQTGIAILLEGRCIGYYHVNKYIPDEPEYQEQTNVGIGFLIGKDYIGRGYGTETLLTLNAWLLTKVDNIWADYFVENTASKKTILKCGFREMSPYDMTFEALGGERKHVISNVLRAKREISVTFRFAQRQDTAQILQFIKGLAEYEKMSQEVVADEKTLEEWIFDRSKAEVIFAEAEGQAVGFALFFHNFSTFLGRAGLYLEDLYVLPEQRGKGYGKALLQKLASIAVERGCGRFEWSCLDWNQPSIDFYRSLGAEPMDEWTVYRVTGDTLKNLAK